ncbi:MAG: hypothetical protein ACI9F9_001210 [Candidatus Paceibacteria bacterium]|jgi:hypothetical protein
MGLIWLALCVSCASYNDQVGELLGQYGSGDLQGAAQQVRDGKLDKGFESRTDGILFLLEGGKILQDAGDYEGSAALFERASVGLEQYDMRADVSISEELLAGVGTQTSRPYRGSAWDRILLEVYQCFNELGRQDLGEAMVRVRRAYRRQSEAVARNADEIAAREEEDNSTGNSALESAEFESYRGRAQTLTSSAYADFVNPMASFLSAVLLREEGSHANSVVDLRKLIELAPNNGYLPSLLEEFEASEAPLHGRIYFIFENGLAPERQEFSLTLPTPNGLTRFAMPYLVPHPTAVGSLRVRGAEGALDLKTELLADMNSVVAADFDAHLAGMVWRIVISQVAKEVASHAIRKNDSNGLLSFAADIYKLVSAKADLRTWRTPGAEFQMAYGARPEDGQVELAYTTGTQDGATPLTLQIPEARTTLVFVRNPGFSPIAPHVFSIGKVSSPSVAATPEP